MGEIYSWVKNIIVFLILTTIISNLLGKSNYKKYVNLVTGLILVLLVISPLFKLLQLEDTLDYYFANNFMLAEAEDINGKLIDMEEGQKSTIFSEYRDKLGTQISSILEKQNLYVVNIVIIINEDEESDTFGNIISMDILASYTRQNTNTDTIKSSGTNTDLTTIDKVNINKIKIGENEEIPGKMDKGNLSPDEINAKNLISDFYNMNPDNINISIQDL